MSNDSKDQGVITALLERFNTQRFPRAMSIKEKVDRGEVLSDADIEFLEEVFADANDIKRLVDKHPEVQGIAARAIGLYKEITDKALENEKKA